MLPPEPGIMLPAPGDIFRRWVPSLLDLVQDNSNFACLPRVRPFDFCLEIRNGRFADHPKLNLGITLPIPRTVVGRFVE